MQRSELSAKSSESLGTTFNKLWSAAMFSKFADGLVGAAIPLLATTLTRDPILISVQSNMMLLPWLFFAIPLGALMDRVNRRFAMLFVQVTRVVIGATIAALIVTGQMSLWVLMLLTFIFGISEVLYDTATQSTIPFLLKGSQLERGNSRLQIADTVMQSFIGAPLGAILFVAFAFTPFMGISGCYVVAIILVSSIAARTMENTRSEATTHRPTLRVEMKEGLVYLWQDKVLLRLVVTTGAVGFCYALGQSTLVLFILDHLHVPEASYGILMIPLAVGALAGAFASPRLSARFGRSQTLAISLPLSALTLLLAGLAPNATWYMAASLLHGFFISQWNILLMSTYHAMIPNEIFGRIHGTRRTLVWGLMPVGGLIGGLLAKIDITLPLIVGGVAATLIATSGINFIKSIQTE
jgi:MFS family permease